MKVSSIDTTTDDQDIQRVLEGTLHAHPGCTEVVGVVADQCQPHCCANAEVSQCLQGLVRSLQTGLIQRKLKPGTLLSFESFDVAHSSLSFACLLGVILQKPVQLQTLLHVTFEGSGHVTFKTETDGYPMVSTSHDLLRKFLDLCEEKASCQIQVSVWSYSVSWVGGHMIKASTEELKDTFAIGTVAAPVKRAPVAPAQLPFGLQMPKRPYKRRKQNPKPKATQTGGRKARSSKSKGEAEDLNEAQDQDDDDESCDSLAEEFGTDDAVGNSGNADSESEVSDGVAPISETVAQESKAAGKLHQEIAACDEKKAEIAQDIRAGTWAFSSFVGLNDVAVAASGRSLCLHCKEYIKKGAIRFSWFYSRVKPYAWVHDYCLFQLATKNNLRKETIHKLKIMLSSSSSSSDPKHAEAQKVLRMLEEAS